MHMHYFVQEYCACWTKGKLQPEMKTRLENALWVVMDVLQGDAERGMREQLKGMRESMDESARGVFRDLYGDYKRARTK